MSGNRNGVASVRPLLRHAAQDLRDHVAGALQHHGVADAHVLAGDLVLVVQAGALHQHAADIHRLQFRHRGQRAGAAHLDADILQHCRCLFGRELPGDRPAGRPADEAKATLQRQVVDLVHDAVDVVFQFGPLHRDVRLERGGVFLGQQQAGQRIHLETPGAQAVQVVPVRVGDGFAGLAHGIGEQRQRPPGGDLRVELAQAAGRGVARVGEHLVAGLGLRRVHRQEVGLGHEHFAADLDQRRGMALQPQRQGFQRAQVGGDVLALGAVTAGGAAGEATVFVGQVDRQAVDLGLPHEAQHGVGRQAQEPAGAGAELGKFVAVHGVVERQHRHAVAQLGEPGLRRGPHPARRRVRADQVREVGLDRGVAAAQGVVFGVGDFRRVLLVVGAVVMRDLPGQALEFGGGLGFGEGVERRGIGRHDSDSFPFGWGAGGRRTGRLSRQRDLRVSPCRRDLAPALSNSPVTPSPPAGRRPRRGRLR